MKLELESTQNIGGDIMANTNYSHHENKIGKVDYAFKRLTDKDIANYSKSTGLGRVWQRVKLGFSGKGYVDSDSIKNMLNQNKSAMTTLKKEKHELMHQAIENAMKNDPNFRRLIGNQLRTTNPNVTEKTINYIVAGLSKAIGDEVSQSSNDMNDWNPKECFEKLNSWFLQSLEIRNLISLTTKEEKNEIIEAMDSLKLSPNLYIPIIEGKMDRILGKDNTYQAKNASALDDNTAKIAKQINILSAAIDFNRSI